MSEYMHVACCMCLSDHCRDKNCHNLFRSREERARTKELEEKAKIAQKELEEAQVKVVELETELKHAKTSILEPQGRTSRTSRNSKVSSGGIGGSKRLSNVSKASSRK